MSVHAETAHVTVGHPRKLVKARTELGAILAMEFFEPTGVGTRAVSSLSCQLKLSKASDSLSL